MRMDGIRVLGKLAVGERSVPLNKSRSIKILLGTSIFFALASFVTCHFGVQHEINQIPPEIRKGMSDFDWVGIEWIALGSMALLAGVLFAFVAVLQWKKQQRSLNIRA
jgi:hypothetical protein